MSLLCSLLQIMQAWMHKKVTKMKRDGFLAKMHKNDDQELGKMAIDAEEKFQ